jgi:hypothetical protein
MAASRFPRSFVLAAAAIGLLTRLAFGLGYWPNERLNRDEVEYLSTGTQPRAGHGYGYDEYVQNGPVEPFGRAPGIRFSRARRRRCELQRTRTRGRESAQAVVGAIACS